jgi:hypothetical protein
VRIADLTARVTRDRARRPRRQRTRCTRRPKPRICPGARPLCPPAIPRLTPAAWLLRHSTRVSPTTNGPHGAGPRNPPSGPRPWRRPPRKHLLMPARPPRAEASRSVPVSAVAVVAARCVGHRCARLTPRHRAQERVAKRCADSTTRCARPAGDLRGQAGRRDPGAALPARTELRGRTRLAGRLRTARTGSSRHRGRSGTRPRAVRFASRPRSPAFRASPVCR